MQALRQTVALLPASQKKDVMNVAKVSLEAAVAYANTLMKNLRKHASPETKANLRRQQLKTYLTRNFGLVDSMLLDLDTVEDSSVRLIQGHVQSGKTRCMIGTMIGLMALHRQSSVIIVRNLRADALQFVGAAQRAINRYGNDMTNKTVPFRVVMANKTSHKRMKDIRSVLRRGNGIIVCLANGNQISRVTDMIEELHMKDRYPIFNLFVDEADDLFDKDPDSAQKFFEEFDTIRTFANKKFCVTATSFDLFFVNHTITNDHVFVLEKPDNYTGVDDLMFVQIPMGARPKFSEKRQYFEIDPYAKQYYRDLSQMVSTVNQPLIVLHKTSRLNMHHKQILDFFVNDETFEDRDKWAVVIYNGEGVTLYHHTLIGEKVKMKSAGGDKIKGVSAGISHTFHDATVGDVLKYLKKRNKKTGDITHIVIISGDLASRGVNFVSSDYKWHLTHMYYISATNASDCDRLQALRVCGVFHHNNFQPVVHAHVHDIAKIKQAHYVMNTIIEAAVTDGSNTDLYDFYRTVELPANMFSTTLSKKHYYSLKATGKNVDVNTIVDGG